VDIENAKPDTYYYMDIEVAAGNSSHIPLGPPSKSDAAHISFDFAQLPSWARRDDRLRFPAYYTIRLILGRQ